MDSSGFSQLDFRGASFMQRKSVTTLIHVHTDYSFDSDVSLDALAGFCRTAGVGCVAITDHDTIAGACRFAEVASNRLNVIIGEEVPTRDGHLIGLFLKRPIRPGMSARDTALAIREQGGLVLLPHPFVTAFGCGLRDVSYSILDLIDAVEVNNAQNLLDRPDRLAREFAERFGLPMYCGTDSHSRSSLMPCSQVLPPFDARSPQAFLRALRQAELRPGRHPLSYFAAAAVRIARHFAALPLPGGFGACANQLGLDVPPSPLAQAA